MPHDVDKEDIVHADFSEIEITPEMMAEGLIAALRSEDPFAFIQGPLDDATVDGCFNLVRVANQIPQAFSWRSQEAVDEAVKHEREVCARLADSYRAGVMTEEIYGEQARIAGSEIAFTIRARQTQEGK